MLVSSHHHLKSVESCSCHGFKGLELWKIHCAWLCQDKCSLDLPRVICWDQANCLGPNIMVGMPSELSWMWWTCRTLWEHLLIWSTWSLWKLQGFPQGFKIQESCAVRLLHGGKWWDSQVGGMICHSSRTCQLRYSVIFREHSDTRCWKKIWRLCPDISNSPPQVLDWRDWVVLA